MTDTVLIVDDEPHVLLLTERILKDQGYEILTARDGLEGKDRIEEEHERLSVIVLDWSMPQMNGIDLLRWIRKQARLEIVPVVMQTVLDTPEHIKEGIEAGCFYYLTKPINREVFRSVIRAAINDFHSKSDLRERLRRSENPFHTLKEGVFEIRTLEEAELLSVRLATACPEPERAMQISELVINALEHGNFGITYDEKTNLIEQNQWVGEMNRRQQLPENKEKVVRVDMKMLDDQMEVVITDAGKGFDFERYLRMDEKRVFDNNGRGIAIANSLLRLQYHAPGNKVSVIVPFQDDSPQL